MGRLSGVHAEAIWRVWGGCLEGEDGCLQDERRLSGGCGEVVWRLKQGCLQGVRKLSRKCVEAV